jgi:hypothetical protein
MIISNISPVVYTPPVLFQPGGKQRTDDADRNEFPDQPQNARLERYFEGSDRSSAFGIQRGDEQGNRETPQPRQPLPPAPVIIGSADALAVPARTLSASQSPDKNDVSVRRAGNQLTEEEQKILDELRQTDERVRAHEQAHQSVAGGLARSKSFTYVTGPDGNRYAVGGEVKIDTSAVAGDPEATARKMQRVQRAALAPSDPSPQDLAVAAAARATESAARIEAARLRTENNQSVRRSAESFVPVRPALPQNRTIFGRSTSRLPETDTRQVFSSVVSQDNAEELQSSQPDASALEFFNDSTTEPLPNQESSIAEQRRRNSLVRAADARIINTRVAFLNGFYNNLLPNTTGGNIIDSVS